MHAREIVMRLFGITRVVFDLFPHVRIEIAAPSAEPQLEDEQPLADGPGIALVGWSNASRGTKFMSIHAAPNDRIGASLQRWRQTMRAGVEKHHGHRMKRFHRREAVVKKSQAGSCRQGFNGSRECTALYIGNHFVRQGASLHSAGDWTRAPRHPAIERCVVISPIFDTLDAAGSDPDICNCICRYKSPTNTDHAG